MKSFRGFTLIELLVVIAIISLLAAILAPVFMQARGKSRQAVCLSSQRQIGLAILQYAQDYDELVPNGLNISDGQRMWGGEGWAGQCMPYVHNQPLFHCPSDVTPVPGTSLTAVSFGYNYNLVHGDDYLDDDIPGSVSLAEMTAPTKSVMLFEVGGVPVCLSRPSEGGNLGSTTGYFSSSGNGLDNRLYGHKDWTTGIDNYYATGLLGGRQPFDMNATQFPAKVGRHNDGANYLLCDGHARWLRGSAVSSGLNALGETCQQDNSNNAPGCGVQFYAAGTGADGPWSATFTTH